jgi:hypothetical protein
VAEALAALDDGELFAEAARRVQHAWEATHPGRQADLHEPADPRPSHPAGPAGAAPDGTSEDPVLNADPQTTPQQPSPRRWPSSGPTQAPLWEQVVTGADAARPRGSASPGRDH